MKTKLVCIEGFTYEGWQRVFCYDAEGVSTAEHVFSKMMECETLDFVTEGVGLYHGKSLGIDCLFVQSAESFTLEDFAECVRNAIGYEVVCQDGEE